MSYNFSNKYIYIIVFLSVFFLSSCFGFNDSSNSGFSSNSSSSWWLVSFSKDIFTINIPKAWNAVDIKSELPEITSWKIELAFKSSINESEFYNNLVIISNITKNLNNIKLSELSELNFNKAKKIYSDLKIIKESQFKTLNKNISKYFIFKAKYNSNTKEFIFLQTTYICELKKYKKAYNITIWVTSEKDPNIYLNILKSFKCIDKENV